MGYFSLEQQHPNSSSLPNSLTIALTNLCFAFSFFLSFLLSYSIPLPSRFFNYSFLLPLKSPRRQVLTIILLCHWLMGRPFRFIGRPLNITSGKKCMQWSVIWCVPVTFYPKSIKYTVVSRLNHFTAIAMPIRAVS